MNAQAEEVDSAAVFAIATSLRKACEDRERSEPALNLGGAYNGWDQFTRELMRVGTVFEEWACAHVAFDYLEDVWSYFLEKFFGESCLRVIDAGGLARFGSCECLRLAFVMGIPVWGDGALPVPVDKVIENPVSGSPLVAFRIRSVRKSLSASNMVPYTREDDPFDERFGERLFGIYGVEANGNLENIAYRESYGQARELVLKLAPGALIRERVVILMDMNTAIRDGRKI